MIIIEPDKLKYMIHRAKKNASLDIRYIREFIRDLEYWAANQKGKCTLTDRQYKYLTKLINYKKGSVSDTA